MDRPSFHKTSCINPATAARAASCETSFEKHYTPGFDLHGFQRCFPDRAAAYFQATGMTPAQIAVAYGVDARTAKNWLEGVVCPRGDKIAVIALRDPAGFAAHFGALASQ